jgi:hypothetical protein
MELEILGIVYPVELRDKGCFFIPLVLENFQRLQLLFSEGFQELLVQICQWFWKFVDSVKTVWSQRGYSVSFLVDDSMCLCIHIFVIPSGHFIVG